MLPLTGRGKAARVCQEAGTRADIQSWDTLRDKALQDGRSWDPRTSKAGLQRRHRCPGTSPLLLCPALSWPLWRPQGWRGLACGWFSQLSTLCAPPWPAAPLLEALPCAPRAAVLAPGWAAWSASERAGPLSGATSQSLVGRQPPTPLTLMPSNRDRARRGRSARNVRSDLMGPISEKPRVWATRLTSETCGKQGRGHGASSGDRWKGSGVPESSTGCERAGSPCPPPIFIIPNCLAFPRTGPAFLGPQRWGKPKRVLAFRP